MRTQEERDEQTLIIGRALGLFVVVLILGWGLGWIIIRATGWNALESGKAYGAVVVVAGTVLVTFLLRSRR